MAKSVVMEDVHSIYLRTGGYLFRPPMCTLTGERDSAGFSPGDRVSARHIGGTRYAKVGDEQWESHGDYIRWDEAAGKVRHLDSTLCWRT